MLLGSIAYQPPAPVIPDIPYTTFAVHFNGSTYLHRGAALTGWGTPSQFTAALWTKLSAATDGIFADANFFTQGAVISGGNHYISMDVASDDTYFDAFGNADLVSASWQGVFISGDLNMNPSSLRIYRNDSDVLNSGDTGVGGDTTIVAGSEFYVGQDGFGTKITGDVADFRLWLGAYADFSQVNTRRRFIRSNGKPADPTLATALLGTPTISFISTGNTASFAANGGSGGTFTTVGTLSMAGTSPTD